MNTVKKTLILCFLAAAAIPAAAAVDRTPEVSRKGRTVVSFKGPRLEAVVGYRWANANPKSTWIPLQVAISGATYDPVEIAREDVSLVTPAGERIALPTQRQFTEGIPDPRPILQAMRVTRDPIKGYFPARDQEELLSFLVPPGERITRDRVTVNRRILAHGVLWFPLVTGVQPGTYRLEIRNKWASAEVPFTVPAPPLSASVAESGW